MDNREEQQLIQKYQEEIACGASRRDVIASLYARGLTIIDTMKMVRQLYGLSLAEAKKQVEEHPVWQKIVKANEPLHSLVIDVFTSTTIYFYIAREQPYGCFSNFSRHGFELYGMWWMTSEHYFQAQKFAGTPDEEEVRLARSPKEAAEMGRQRTRPLRGDWEKVKDEVMLRAVLRKFETHADIRAILLATGDELIVENAPGDYYWGCGADGSGKNRLGEVLMMVRTMLCEREQSR